MSNGYGVWLMARSLKWQAKYCSTKTPSPQGGLVCVVVCYGVSWFLFYLDFNIIIFIMLHAAIVIVPLDSHHPPSNFSRHQAQAPPRRH
jgi:hypothetical protein